MACTARGSTLSRLVHSEIALRADLPGEGVTLYEEALGADFHNQSEDTAEGIHIGIMAGTIWQAVSCFGGLDLKGEVPSFAPHFPASWKSIGYGFTFRGNRYEVRMTPKSLNILAPTEVDSLAIRVQGEQKTLRGGEWNNFSIQPNIIGEPPFPNLD